MTRLRSSLESLTCSSWLVYATRADTEAARRVKNLILDIKKVPVTDYLPSLLFAPLFTWLLVR